MVKLGVKLSPHPMWWLAFVYKDPLNKDAIEEMATSDGGSDNGRIAFRNRPIDVLSFLSRDELTVKDEDSSNTRSSMKEGAQGIELQVIQKDKRAKMENL